MLRCNVAVFAAQKVARNLTAVFKGSTRRAMHRPTRSQQAKVAISYRCCWRRRATTARMSLSTWAARVAAVKRWLAAQLQAVPQRRPALQQRWPAVPRRAALMCRSCGKPCRRRGRRCSSGGQSCSSGGKLCRSRSRRCQTCCSGGQPCSSGGQPWYCGGRCWRQHAEAAPVIVLCVGALACYGGMAIVLNGVRDFKSIGDCMPGPGDSSAAPPQPPMRRPP